MELSPATPEGALRRRNPQPSRVEGRQPSGHCPRGEITVSQYSARRPIVSQYYWSHVDPRWLKVPRWLKIVHGRLLNMAPRWLKMAQDSRLDMHRLLLQPPHEQALHFPVCRVAQWGLSAWRHNRPTIFSTVFPQMKEICIAIPLTFF